MTNESSSSSRESKTNSAVETVFVAAFQLAIELAIGYCVFRMGSSLLDFDGESKKDARRNEAKLKAQLAQNQRKPFVMNSYEKRVAGDLIDPSTLSVTFTSIGGLEKQKQELRDLVILPLRRPELFTSKSKLMSTPKGILLYGPPGKRLFSRFQF